MQPDSHTTGRPNGSATPAVYFAVRIMGIMKREGVLQRKMLWLSFVINFSVAEIVSTVV
jgi:hypothetical protein